MDERARVSLSKFLSLVLRHRPGAIGIRLDHHGWVEVGADACVREVWHWSNGRKRFLSCPSGHEGHTLERHAIHPLLPGIPTWSSLQATRHNVRAHHEGIG